MKLDEINGLLHAAGVEEVISCGSDGIPWRYLYKHPRGFRVVLSINSGFGVSSGRVARYCVYDVHDEKWYYFQRISAAMNCVLRCLKNHVNGRRIFGKMHKQA